MAGNMIFAQRIKSLRNAHNESQATLAKEINYQKQSISHWENNGKVPRTDVLRFLAKRYGVSTDYLLGNDEDVGQADEADKVLSRENKASVLSNQEKFLLRMFNRMDKKQKEILLKMLDAFTCADVCRTKEMPLLTENSGTKVAEEREQYQAKL